MSALKLYSPDMHTIEEYSNRLGYRTLLITSMASLLGSALGMIAVGRGVVVGLERPLVLLCFLYSCASLLLLRFSKRIEVEKIARVSTIFFAVYLSAGIVISLFSEGEHFHVLIYLIWFYPLLVYNRVVTASAAATTMARVLQVLPIVLVASLSWRMMEVFSTGPLAVLEVFCVSYAGYGLLLNAVNRYRDAYILERERGKMLEVASTVLDSVSDCFISLDSELRLIYLNRSACAELGLELSRALNEPLQIVAPGFFSETVRIGLAAATLSSVETSFEAQNDGLDEWYVVRCYPRPDSMSVYFRNNTEAMRSRLRLETAHARIEHLAYFDPLTDLPNRVLLRERLEMSLATASESGRSGAMLLIDVDDFKTLNDTKGQEVGDLFLKEVALRLSACARIGSTVARLGGDEFVLMREDISDDLAIVQETAMMAADKIMKAFSEPFKVGGHEFDNTVTVGVTMFPEPADTVDETLKRAELAMYRGKDQGGKTTCFFDPVMARQAAARAALQAHLRRALSNREFELHYQPLVSAGGRVIGAEALLRWRHPVRGWVPPSEFIPLAEKDGLILEIGRWVLRTACTQLALWQEREGFKGLSIAVNVSPLQFLDSNFVNVVREALLESGANPQRLKLEITESSLVERVEDAIAKMDALRTSGVSFSLDDFGTGYSSLSHLKRLSLDQLKIDRSFVKDVLTDVKSASIVRTIVMLAKSLNLTVVAEGVETEEQCRFMEGHECDFYQGYLFSPALAASRFERFVENANLGGNLGRQGLDVLSHSGVTLGLSACR